jgi:predicted class III extradiol MEMO1 family dioxygenase
MSELIQKINDRIYTFFIESSDFNVIPLRNISQEFSIDYKESIDIIIELVKENFVSIQSSSNPHIIGFKHHEINKQVEVRALP